MKLNQDKNTVSCLIREDDEISQLYYKARACIRGDTKGFSGKINRSYVVCTGTKGYLAKLKKIGRKTFACNPDLNFRDFVKWYCVNIILGCPVLKVPYMLVTPNQRRKVGNTNPYSPSIDRIDPEKGYTFDNMIMVSFFVNNARSTNSYGDFFTIIRKINTNIKGMDLERLKPSMNYDVDIQKINVLD